MINPVPVDLSGHDSLGVQGRHYGLCTPVASTPPTLLSPKPL